jgi:hypothetical protein
MTQRRTTPNSKHILKPQNNPNKSIQYSAARTLNCFIMRIIFFFDFLFQKCCMFNKTISYLCTVNLVETCAKVKKISAEKWK